MAGLFTQLSSTSRYFPAMPTLFCFFFLKVFAGTCIKKLNLFLWRGDVGQSCEVTRLIAYGH